MSLDIKNFDPQIIYEKIQRKEEVTACDGLRERAYLEVRDFLNDDEIARIEALFELTKIKLELTKRIHNKQSLQAKFNNLKSKLNKRAKVYKRGGKDTLSNKELELIEVARWDILVGGH